MRPWLVEVEGADLGLDNGPVGFFANRFVLANSKSAAVEQAFAITVKGWRRRFQTIGGSPPRLFAGEVQQIGWMHYLTHKRQNRGYTFFLEE